MSDPTRYSAAGTKIVETDPAGPLVEYVDYAILKAEVARLKAELAYDKRVQLHVDKLAAEFTQSEVERLKAEVERLRKAGDAMAETLEGVGFDSAMDFWNAANREQGCLVNPIKVAQYLPKPPAKEGKQP